MQSRLAVALALVLAVLPAAAGVIALPGRHGHVVTPPPPPPPNNNVYAGCTIPGGGTGATWYIDSVNGTTQVAGADGSQAKPWNSLAAVWGTKTNGVFGPVPGYNRPLLSSVTEGVGGGTGPIHPGDTIIVMGGNYAGVTIGDFQNEVSNSDWVTVKAHPGQTPVVQFINIGNTNKTIFDGLKIQSRKDQNGGEALISVGDGGASFPTSDIVLRNLDMSSMEHSASIGLTQQQLANEFTIGLADVGSSGNGTNGVPYTTCVSFVNNKVHDVTQGIILFSNNSLVSGNEISYFGHDGLDYGASNLAITHNYEHDVFSLNDGNHQDAMQGQIGPFPTGGAPENLFSNVLIDSNIVIRQTDPNLQYPSYLQGIDAFDEDWTNVTVTNNVIVTSSCYGIVYGSIHNSLIADDTIVDDGQIVSGGCAPQVNVTNTTHEGLPSSNVKISNVTASEFALYTTPTNGVISDHVVIIPLAGQQGSTAAWFIGGSAVFFSSPGSYTNSDNGSTVTISSAGPAATYVNYNPAGYTYDLHPRASSPITGTGTSGSPLPTIDITGAARSQPYDVGAYTLPQVFALPNGDVVHYLSPSGNDSNNGTSPATPWLTANHSLNCGDVIVAATGTYSSTVGLGSFGTVSNCPSTTGGIDGTGGVWFATVLCAGKLTTCDIPWNGSVSSYSVDITKSNWAVEGFSAHGFTNGSRGGFNADGSAATIHHVAFINDIAYNVGVGFSAVDDGVDHDSPGATGYDYTAVVGSIAQNAEQNTICTAEIVFVAPATVNSITYSGTHFLMYGNFAWNTGNNACGTDLENYMFDTFDAHGVTSQSVIMNNIGWSAYRMGIQLTFGNFNNVGGLHDYLINNTQYDDNLANSNPAFAELNVQMNNAGAAHVAVYNNIAYGTQSHSCPLLIGGDPSFAPSSLANVVAGGTNLQNVLYSPVSGTSTCYFNGYTGSGNVNYTNTNPLFMNTTDLLANQNGAPNCAGFTNTTACMGWNATTGVLTATSVIGDLTPACTNCGGNGYQKPTTACTTSGNVSTYFPTWLKGIVYLQWNAATSTITENYDLVTKPCGL